MTMQTLAPDSERHFTWDAWGRLVKVEYKPNASTPKQERARYAYYGRNQRAYQITDTDQDSSQTPDRLERFYYDTRWRLLERRIDDSRAATLWTDLTVSYDATSEIHQSVWGKRYVDEMVMFTVAKEFDPAGTTGPGFLAPVYAMTDRTSSVIHLGGSDGAVATATKTRYTPHGEVTASGCRRDGRSHSTRSAHRRVRTQSEASLATHRCSLLSMARL